VATPTLNLPPGIYVNNVSVNPPQPRAGSDPIQFSVEFLNTTPRPARYNWCVEIFAPDDLGRSVGITSCQLQEIPVGDSVLEGALWNVQRIGSCTPYLAKAIFKDQQQARVGFLQTDGSNYWLNFTVCP
jgi:hypothetical protein